MQSPDPDAIQSLEYDPPRATAAISGFAALAVVAAVSSVISVGLLVAAAGVLVIGAGIVRGQARSITLGGGLQAAGVGIAGVAGLPPVQAVIGIAAAMIAWDTGLQTVEMGTQIGDEHLSIRAEIVRAGTSLVAVTGVAAVATTVFVLSRGEYPVSALAALLVASVVLLVVLRAGG